MAYDFETALRARLAAIDDMGVSQTTFQKLKAQREANARAMQNQMAMLDAYQPNQQVGSPQDVTGGGGSAFDKFKNAIAQQESGGNYNARNPSGALGKYQIMSGNVPAWSRQALGYSVTPAQFMSPAIQEKVATYYLDQYYKKYGAAGAAVAWYAGEGTAQKWIRAGGGGTYNRTQAGGYPSINRYVQQIMARMK
jgi:hypothetical protein